MLAKVGPSDATENDIGSRFPPVSGCTDDVGEGPIVVVDCKTLGSELDASLSAGPVTDGDKGSQPECTAEVDSRCSDATSTTVNENLFFFEGSSKYK